MALPEYTSSLAESLAPGLLERFQRYVRIGTQSRRDVESSPSSPGQLELGRLLADELKALGISDAQIDEHGYVLGTVPPPAGMAGAAWSAVGLVAHLDTSPDAPGAGVEPIVHRAWDGEPIELPRGGTVLDPAAMPELATRRGCDIVTASGDTLLGADDKAGVAAIMTAVEHLMAQPELPRAALRIAFTPDEEIGSLAKYLDPGRFGVRCAYTVDGGLLGELEDESFAALEAQLTFHGVDVHPGYAAGKMVSALRLAARAVAALPSDALAPEVSSGRQGYIHPYELTGTAARAELRVILRDFDEDSLSSHVALLERTARAVVDGDPRARVEIDVQRQYRNMHDYIAGDPDIVAAAEEAFAAEVVEPVRNPIRGGTDGSSLSERGVPTPNLFAGGHDWHSVREWASLQDMAAAAAVLVRLAGVWARRV